MNILLYCNLQVKLPWSFNFLGSLFWILELHSSLSAIVSSVSLILLDTISFMYSTYFGIPCKMSTKERLMWTYLIRYRNLLKHSFSFLFLGLCTNGGDSLFWRIGTSALEHFTTPSTFFFFWYFPWHLPSLELVPLIATHF